MNNLNVYLGVCVLPLATATSCLYSQDAHSEHVDRWEDYRGITGVGEVEKTSPKETDWLHFDKDGQGEGAETATFEIDMTEASDEDRYVYCDTSTNTIESYVVDWLEPNSGYGATVTWSATGGSIGSDGVFVPGESPNSNAMVWADIGDPNVGSNGETERKRYHGSLKVFKVGVRVRPAGFDYWEDDLVPLRSAALESGDAKLFAHASTGNLSRDDDDDDSVGWSGDTEWETITEPGNAGTAIQKEIFFRPSFIGLGGMHIREHNSFLSDAGSGSRTATVLAVAGVLATTPYVKASVSIGLIASTASKHGRTSGAIAGATTIRFVGEGSFKAEENGTPQQFFPTNLATVAFADLSISGEINEKEGVKTEGSYEVNSGVLVIDNDLASRGEIVIKQSGIAAPALGYASTRPEYR